MPRRELPQADRSGTRLHCGFVLALAAARRCLGADERTTVLGFEMRAVGANRARGARFAGMPVDARR